MILALAFGRTLTLTEASKEFGLSKRNLEEWIKRGWLQTTKRGIRRISRDELIQLITLGQDWKGDVVARTSS